MKKILFIITVLMTGLMSNVCVSAKAADSDTHWVGTWATAPMESGSNNNPPSPGLANNSLRQIVQVSIGGETVRLKLSNHFGNAPVEIKGVELAIAKTAGSSSEIEETSTVSLTFGGSSSVTIAKGTMVASDPVAFALTPRQNVAITIHYGSASSSVVCGHPGSRTTSYLKSGNTTDFTSAAKTDHWYHILALEVDAATVSAAPASASASRASASASRASGASASRASASASRASAAPASRASASASRASGGFAAGARSAASSATPAAIAVLGNSITDGRGSTTNQQNRWTDAFSRCLLDNESTSHLGVLNLGIGGNCVLSGGLGPAAVSRAQRDLFEQEGVSYIILFEGVNDLGGAGNGVQTARRIIDAYRQIIRQAHAKGIRVIGATITPFKGNSYYSADHEAGRQKLNQWIKTSAMLDGVIDFAAAVCSPNDSESLDSKYLFENDHLHLNATGYKVMGECIDLSLFTQTGPLAADDEEEVEEVTGIWIEAESLVTGGYGTNYALREDVMASGGKYLETVKNITDVVSDKDADRLMADFTIDTDDTYYIYARVSCPSWDDDSYWVSMDGGQWEMVNGLYTGGAWQWLQLYKGRLAKGSHRLGISGREDGACIDKLCITTSSVPPETMGGSPTGIGATIIDKAQGAVDTNVYDLQGRRITTGHRAAANSQHSLLIANGKKVIVSNNQ